MLGAQRKNSHHLLANPAVLEMVPYRPRKTISAICKEYHIQDVVKLASNENHVGPSPFAIQAIIVALYDIHLYSEGGVGTWLGFSENSEGS